MSKELEALKKIENYFIDLVSDKRLIHEECKDTEKYVRKSLHIEDIEKSLKAFEVIKEKVMPLVSLEIRNSHYRVYDAEGYGFNELTQEEYDLLKEVEL